MKTRRIAIVGLLVIAATGLAVGGCAKAGTGGQPALGLTASAAPSPAGPKSVLLAAVQKLHTTSYKYHATPSTMTTVDAIVDPAHSAISVSTITKNVGISTEENVIKIGADYWLYYGPHGWLVKDLPGGKYIHLAAAKLGVGNTLAPTLDPALAASKLIGATGEVTQVDSQHFTGTFGPAKVGASAAPNQDAQTHAPDSVETPPPVTFTAVLDSQGRLTDFKIETPSLGVDEAMEVSYSDYGTAVTISKPAASETVEATQSVYDMFTGDGSSK